MIKRLANVSIHLVALLAIPACGGGSGDAILPSVALPGVATIAFPSDSLSSTANLSASTTTDASLLDALKSDAPLIGATMTTAYALAISVGAATVLNDSIAADLVVPPPLLGSLTASSTIIALIRFRYANAGPESGEDEAYFDAVDSVFNQDTGNVEISVPRVAFDLENGINTAFVVLAVVPKGPVTLKTTLVDRSMAASAPTAGNLASPLNGGLLVVDSFGRVSTVRSGRHSGVDLRASVGTPIYAMTAGTVVAVGSDSRSGKYVVMKHLDGSASSFAHLSTQSVAESSVVARGDLLGLSGNSPAVAPHVHLSLGALGSKVSKVKTGGQSTTYTIMSRQNPIPSLVAALEILQVGGPTQLNPGDRCTLAVKANDSNGIEIRIRRVDGNDLSIVSITAGSVVGASDVVQNAELKWNADKPSSATIPSTSQLIVTTGPIRSDSGQNEVVALPAGGLVVITAKDNLSTKSASLQLAIRPPFEVQGRVVSPSLAVVPGISVTLSGHTDRGTLVNVFAITDTNGLATFAGVLPGDYVISLTLPSSSLVMVEAYANYDSTQTVYVPRVVRIDIPLILNKGSMADGNAVTIQGFGTVLDFQSLGDATRAHIISRPSADLVISQTAIYRSFTAQEYAAMTHVRILEILSPSIWWLAPEIQPQVGTVSYSYTVNIGP